VAVDGEVRSILVTSCTQAEGKTSTVCNLAVTLVRAGKKVVVVEADLRRPKVHSYFGVRNDRGLSSVIAGQCALDDALQEVRVAAPGLELEAADARAAASTSSAGQRLWLLTSGPLPPNPGEIVSSARMSNIIDQLSGRADVVLVDSPPFLVVGETGPLASKVDGILIVMKLGHVTRQMVRDAVEFLRPLPCRKLGIVVTNAPVEGGSYRYRYQQQADARPAEAPVTVGGV
jgi:non-specific protein-tyrosine kinase